MPYSTSNNPGMAQAANSIAKIFVGDPEADAAYKNNQIKNETEYARQRMLQEQMLSEGVRRKQMEAAAAASYAAAKANQGLADERGRKNTAATDLGSIFTQDHRDFSTPGGMSKPGDAPAGTPGAGFDLNNPAIASRVVQNMLTGEMDPKVLSAMALMPGQDDNTLARIMTGSGQTIGKDDYVSLGDRNTNRNYELGANERLVGGGGNVMQGVDPSYADSQSALAKQRNATAKRQETMAAGGGGKIPRLDQAQMNSMVLNAILAQGAQIPKNDEGDYSMGAAAYLSGQPEIYADMSRLIDEAYRLSGGRASAVQDALSQYLSGADFSNFRQRKGEGMFNGAPRDVFNPIQRPDLESIMSAIQQMYGQGAGISPEIFTEGGDGDLQNLQNVGNTGGWQVIGVE